MKKFLIGFAAAGFLAGAILPVTAATKMASHKMAAATVKCPVCSMPMPMKKTAATPVAVKVGKKTYYCCASCAAGKKALAAMKMNKPMAMKKSM